MLSLIPPASPAVSFPDDLLQAEVIWVTGLPQSAVPPQENDRASTVRDPVGLVQCCIPKPGRVPGA